jgi:hypothetical protein
VAALSSVGRGRGLLQIKDILQTKQPEVAAKLHPARQQQSPRPSCRPVEASRGEILECMGHGAWKRGQGGAVRQIRWK